MIAETLQASEATCTRTALTNEEAARYRPRINRIAKRIARKLPQHVQVSDLESAGFLGLIDAFEKYDMARTESFEAYVDARIRGAIFDELRTQDPLSRDQRIFARKLSAAKQSVSNETGCPPTEHDIARKLGITLADYRAKLDRMTAMAARNEAVLYDEIVVDSEGGNCEQPDVFAEDSERRAVISKAIATLPSRMGAVLQMMYVEGRTMKEAGVGLGVTESRVSQLHSQAMTRLRGVLSPD